MDKDQLVCLWGAPSPIYKGGEEEAGQPQGVRQGGRNPTPSRSRFPLFLVQLGEGGKGEEGKEGREGPRPKPIVQFGLGLGGARTTSWLLPTKAQ